MISCNARSPISIFNIYVIIVYYSMKVHGIKVVENQAFGITTPTSIQVPPQMHPESNYMFSTPATFYF